MDRKSSVVFRNVAIAGIIILAIVGFSFFSNGKGGYQEVDTSVALAELDKGNVREATIQDREQQLQFTLKDEITPPDGGKATDKIVASYPEGASEQMFDRVAKAAPEKFDTEVTQRSALMEMAQFLLPMLILFGLAFFFLSRIQGGRGGLFGVGKSRAVEVTKDMPKTTFADVAGEDEAVEELNEIKDFLQNPSRYERLGAKIPRGVLLYGPPGTGKTLLARAVAGEAGVPFYSISGSDFVEMFVGVGASRVRDLFEKAKQNSPCIVFVDEIDAVGRQRGAGLGGGHDEREQTLNQLLVEMDGFDDRQTVILIAATNRPDVLDPALLRPGRFDRQVPVVNPDLKGREAILAVHSRGKPLAPDVDVKALAKRTIGMSGADLANVLNEGALLAARLGRDVIDEEVLEEAGDRVVGGPRRKHRVISEHEKKVTAYHESGHALAAWAMEDLEPVHKVTILARGRTGGHALVVPEDDKSLMTRADMLARIVMAMGGRAAEEYVFGEPTSGASSDIEQATKIARAMVTEYGMSAALGAVKYGDEDGDPFLGRGGGGGRDYSDHVARTIDDEVRRIIDAAHDEAFRVLEANRKVLDRCAAELLEKETLRQEDLERIFADVTKRPRITTFDDFGGRTPSTEPPIKTPGELAAERGEPWPPPVTDPFSLPSPVAGRGPGPQGGPGQGGPGQGGPGQPGAGPGGPGQPLPGRGPSGRGYAGPGGQQQYGGPTQQPAGPPSLPAYGTPPPAGWSAPGWPPADDGGDRYDGRGHGAPTYGAPTHGTPTHDTPAHGTPAYDGSGYGGSGYGGPGAGSPGDAATTRIPTAPDADRQSWSRGGPPVRPGRRRAPEPGRGEPTGGGAGTPVAHTPSSEPTRAHPVAEGWGRSGPDAEDPNSPGTGSHRREDRDDGWTPPWERRDGDR